MSDLERIERNKKIYTAGHLADILNDWLINDEFWWEEYDCSPDDIVERFGFGYSCGEEPGVVFTEDNDIIYVNINLEKLKEMVSMAKTDTEKRQTLLMIYANGVK